MAYSQRKQKEFEIVYENYKHAIYKVSLYYSKDEVAAEEITQKVFYELYLHFEGANIRHMYCYLHQAARNTAYNWANAHKRLEYMSNDQIADWQEYQAGPSSEEVYLREEQKMAAKALSECIMERMRKKSKLWHEAIYLVYGLEKSADQVAEELGVSRDVIHSRIYRATQWAKKHYREAYEDVKSWPC